MVESVSVIGAVIALAYAATIGSILSWMLRVPKAGDVEQHARRIERESRAFRRILVPVQSDVLSDRLVALASQMARYRGASLEVLYVVEVPYTLPINAGMERQIAAAEDAFTHAEKIAAKYDVKIQKRMERARSAGPAIVQYAATSGADVLLMADVPNSNRRGTKLARTVEYVFEHAPCEVLIDRPRMS